MRRLLPLLLSCLLAACAGGQIVPKAPPAYKEEEPTARPSADMFWRSGHWSWDEGKQLHVWVEGVWEEQREGYIWFPGGWEPVDEGGQRKGWRWVPERWVQLVDLDRDLPQ